LILGVVALDYQAAKIQMMANATTASFSAPFETTNPAV